MAHYLVDRIGRSARSGSVAVPDVVPVLGGAGAAVLGLGVVLAPVFLLWVFSPYLAGGPGSALHTAACLWLAAHGTDLRRAGVDGSSIPVGVTPLLLSAVNLVLLRRAGKRWGLVAPGVGYLAVAAVVVGVAAGPGTVTVRAWAAFGWVALCVLGVVGVPAVVPWVAERLGEFGELGEFAGEVRLAVRAGGAASVVLVGMGAVVWLVALLVHFGASGRIAGQLAPDSPGRLALLLLCAGFAPNAAVWGAAYAVGSGFSVGAAGQMLVSFPLLGAVAGAGGSVGSGGVGRLALVGAMGAGAVVAFFALRARSLWAGGGVVLGAAVVGGVLTGVAGAAAGGPLGVRALEHVGPEAWVVGGLAFVWIVGVGLPVLGGVRGIAAVRAGGWSGVSVGWPDWRALVPRGRGRGGDEAVDPEDEVSDVADGAPAPLPDERVAFRDRASLAFADLRSRVRVPRRLRRDPFRDLDDLLEEDDAL